MNKHTTLKTMLVVSILGLVLLGNILSMHWLVWIIPLVLVHGGSMFYFSMNMRHNFFLKSTIRFSDDCIMLSFDDGPHPIYTPQVLDILKLHNVRAMFFLIGAQMEAHPDIVQSIIREGHMVGGHSYSHKPSFGILSRKKVEVEIMRTQDLVDQHGGNKFLFRPPYGVTNPRIAAVTNKHKLKVIGWTCRSYDTLYKTPEKLLHRIQAKLKSGDIILMHDRLPQTSGMLEDLIIWVRSEGMEFGVLDEE